MKIISLALILLFGLNPKVIEFPPKKRDQLPPNVIRTCCAFGHDLSIARIPFLKKNDLIDFRYIGQHEYLGGAKELNGIIYTSKGGFIDLGHLRDYADWTVFLYKLLETNKNEPYLNLELGHEGGTKNLEIKMPLYEVDLYELAGSIAYDLSLWHEISTWYGSSYIPLVPEAYSSFSPEDLYSNLLGIRLGMEAAKSKFPFETAMDSLLSAKLKSLGAVDLVSTYNAMSEVEGDWWSSAKALPSSNILLKRYFDQDNYLNPWLVDINNDAVAVKKPVKNLQDLYVLSIQNNHKIKRENFNFATITQKDFPEIIALIKLDNEQNLERLNEKQEKLEARKFKKEVRKIEHLSTL